MSTKPTSDLPESAFCVLPEERMQYLVDLYRRAVETGDDRIVNAADEALRYFRDTEAALTRMLSTEATVLRLLGD
jgi:hypothetical protein